MTSLEKMVSDLDSQINADTTLDPQIRELYLPNPRKNQNETFTE